MANVSNSGASFINLRNLIVTALNYTRGLQFEAILSATPTLLDIGNLNSSASQFYASISPD